MIDSHCHIAGEEFAGDLGAVVERARAAGVTTAVCILAAGDDAESARAVAVRQAWPGVRFAVGIHPHQAGAWNGRMAEASALVRRGVQLERACAIGEIGLDYHYDFARQDVQQQLFAAQVRLARALRLPIVIHTREATDDTFRILHDAGGGEVRGVFHCFTGDDEMARMAVDAGFHVSFAGIVTFPRAVDIRQAARVVPADRVLVETDSPYLAPVPVRGARNEPAHVAHVFERLAAVRGVAVEELAAQVTSNFEALFAPQPAGSAGPTDHG